MGGAGADGGGRGVAGRELVELRALSACAEAGLF